MYTPKAINISVQINIILDHMGGRVSKKDVKVPHFYFGQVSQKNQYNRQIITVSKKMLRKDQYGDWLKIYHQVKNLYHQSLLIPESYQIEEIKNYLACCECPADFQISLSYQKFDYLYKSEIVQRKKNGQFYREEELFFILYKCLTGMKEFQLAGKRVGDIRPSQMVITNRKDIQLISVASFPWELSSMDKILDSYDSKTKFYLAPEEIQALNNKSRVKIIDAKAEAFSLGMSILQAALLQNSQDLYAFNPRSIDTKELQSRLQQVKKKYPLLQNYLHPLLHQKVEQRLSGGQLWAMLNLYSEKIADYQTFKRNQGGEGGALAQFRRKSNQ